MTIGVFGLGNVLRRDDGFGPSAARWLAARFEFPASVHLRDLGTPGLDLPSYLSGHDAVLLLDTTFEDGAAGTRHRYTKEALLASHAPGGSLSSHAADLGGALAVLALRDDEPAEVVLLGVVPSDVGNGIGLSSSVEAALRPTGLEALQQLRQWGVEPKPRPRARPASDWWRLGEAAAS